MNAFATGMDALFEDPNISRNAVWRSGGAGEGTPVRVVLRTPDQIGTFGGGRFVATGRLLACRVAEISDLEAGDSFEIDGDTFIVQGEPMRDGEGLIWNAEVRPQ